MKRYLEFAILSATAGALLAQSSGSFNYATTGNNNSTACTLNNNGNISGGFQCQQSCTVDPTTGIANCTTASGQCMGNAVVAMKTNSGNGNVFVVRPSAVIGLLTDVSLQKNTNVDIGTSSSLAGVNFTVSVTGPGSPAVTPSFPVTYDARYVQISSNLFTVLATQCLATTGGCFFNFNESTVSAHSFDWIVSNLQSGVYTVTVNWQDALNTQGISSALACVGPLNATVQQNKIFNFNKPGTVTAITTP